MKDDSPPDAMPQYYILLVTLTDRGNHLTYSCSYPPGPQLPLGLSPQTLARICCPKHVLCNQLLEFTVDSFRFISWCVTLDATKGSLLTKFNVVAVVPVDQPNRHGMARNVIPQLAFALCHEQSHRSFMSDSVTLLSQLRDLQNQDVNTQLRSCSLVRSLNEICEALATNTLVNIRVNARIHVGIGEGVAAGHQNDIHSVLRPYRTILLLEDADSLLVQLPDDASTSLRRLIRVVSPMKSFRDLSVDLGLPITHIFRIAAHLVLWRKARIMNTLTKHSVLTINSDAVLSQSVSEAFHSAFPTLGLPDQMSRFTLPKRLEEHLRILGQAAQHQIITLIVFLLRHSLIILLHTYVSVIPDHGLSIPVSSGAGSRMYSSSIESASGYRQLSTSPQFQPDLSFNGTKSSKLRKLFHRLLPYFNGEHHIEEIMWAENISRQDIAQILHEFGDQLCTYNHEGLS